MELARQSGPTRRRPDGAGPSSLVQSPADTLLDTLVVFGGTGFVGSAVLTAALLAHPLLHILVVTRTGAPPAYYASDAVLQSKRLNFVVGDLLGPKQAIEQALLPWTTTTISDKKCRFIGCISCVGCITPWNQQNMVATCGDANIAAYQISRTVLGVPKFVVMTRDRTNWNDWWYPFPYILPGYYQGKRKIEAYIANDVAAADNSDNRGRSCNAVCLRAGFVVGTRRTIPGLSTRIPVYAPLQCPCRIMKFFSPTIDVDELAGAAVRFVLAPKERKADTVLVENDQIPSFFL